MGCGSCRPEVKSILDEYVNVIKKEDGVLVT
jgi:NAD(P)H-nitrite reductase large subunit